MKLRERGLGEQGFQVGADAEIKPRAAEGMDVVAACCECVGQGSGSHRSTASGIDQAMGAEKEQPHGGSRNRGIPAHIVAARRGAETVSGRREGCARKGLTARRVVGKV